MRKGISNSAFGLSLVIAILWCVVGWEPKSAEVEIRYKANDAGFSINIIVLASEKFCNWIIMRRSVNLRSE